MSLWTNIRDTGESLFSAASPIDIRSDSAKKQTEGVAGAANAFRDKATDFLHNVSGVPTADQKRQQSNLINSQIKAYKDQTELTRQELNRKSSEVAAEKRRVEEKQIRSLRRNYRAAGQGFLGTQASSQDDMNTKLGD